MNLNIDNEKENILDIYNKFILMHGIKPNINEEFSNEDDYIIMINKFDKWYDRALEFATGDVRDIAAFYSIIHKFKEEIYCDFINTEIENNIFIQNMLYKLNIGGQKYIYPNLIINISNIIFDNDIIKLDINNINFEYIDNITIDSNQKIYKLYNIIYNKLKNIYNLYNLEQLKLLYNNTVIENNDTLIYTNFVLV
jgi:hypothetical protein